MTALDERSPPTPAESPYVFVAFSADPRWLFDTIMAGIAKANATQTRFRYHGWPANDVPGRPLVGPVQSGISDAAFVVADVSTLNLNVTYEIGFAIGTRKRAYLIKNPDYADKPGLAAKVGIFDTLGYQEYQSSDSLGRTLSSITDVAPIDFDRSLDSKAPIYVIEPPNKGDTMLHIISCVKRTRFQYRSFNPSEDTRLAASDAITHVSRSHGVIVPLLSNDVRDSSIHNTRAAFVAGLAHGMEKPTLVLKPVGFDAPLDIRDAVKEYVRLEDINTHVNQLALDVVESMQRVQPLADPPKGTLARLTIGDPMAENEFQTLGKYYLRREEFHRTLRGEVNLVVGRKGSGKTALFSQVRDDLRRNPTVIVLDLKPEGYQLIKLRERVLDFLHAGAKDHLITSFWEYLLLREVAYKLLEKDRQRHLRDYRLYPHYTALGDAYRESPHVVAGDFSERLASLAELVADEFQSRVDNGGGRRLSADDVTQIVHSGSLRNLRQKVSKYLEYKQGVWILFDNLDKGWTVPGPSDTDILVLRCLIDGARKCQRDMQADGHDFHSIVFVRNDVYELLIRESADFGKEMRASLDWSDPDMLRELLRLRLVNNGFPAQEAFDKIWKTICVSHHHAQETSQYMIDRSLMRPRNLLKLFNHCKASASNLGHGMISSDDIDKGVLSYSNDLLIEADQELANIEAAAADLIYYFIGEDYVFSLEDLEIIFNEHGIRESMYQDLVRFLLYFGFLGIKIGGTDPKYIFDVGYDMKRLQVPVSKAGSTVQYVLNPAFWPALGVGPEG